FEQRVLLGHQVFGVGVEFVQTRGAEMLSLGIVASAFDLLATAIFPKLAKSLPTASERIVDFARAQADLIPFALQIGFLPFAVLAFGAQRFHLQALLLAPDDEIGFLSLDRCLLRGKGR